ncbi:MAG: ATP-binding protein [Candidatus Omnitrophota bacterium]
MIDNQLQAELIQKYRLAGRIRFISSSLLFAFLLLMKFMGGYSYINPALSALIFVEAALNQPYNFFIKRVNLHRFKYYQMLTDIIAISWVLYYIGGIEASVVIMAYCAVILWAGVVSSTAAVFFAAIASCFFLSLVVLLKYDMPTPQVLGLLIGNVSFLFAFGYFSARSSAAIKDLQRKRQEESLRYTHRLSTTGYLVGKTAHDIRSCLAGIRANVQVLLSLGKQNDEEKKFLNSVEYFEKKGADLIQRLVEFSQKPTEEYMTVDINSIIEEALKLTEPLVKYSKMTVEKEFEQSIMPKIAADKGQMLEVFVVLILNSLDSISTKPKGGILTVKTRLCKEKDVVEIVFSDTGIGIRQDDLRRIGEPFFSTKIPGESSGLGMATAYDIISRHKGKIAVKSIPGESAVFTISLPVEQLTKTTL